MTRALTFASMLLGCAALAGCGGAGTCAIAAGTSIAVSRASPTGTCPADVVAGVIGFNGTETFTPMKNISCQGGPSILNLTLNFHEQDAGAPACSGADALSFTDLAADGGTGTDTMAITCADGINCTEMFAITFAPN